MAQALPATGCPLVTENQPPKIVTIGGRDARELYLEHCTLAALDAARDAEIAQGRPPLETLH
jgi:hypothetical protein